MRGKLIAAVLALYAAPAFGQTAADFGAKYGVPINNAYSVSEHVLMEPEYATDGQVCRMRLYPKGIPPNPNHEFIALPYGEVKNALNQLVPLTVRGAKQGIFGVITTLGGGVAWMEYPYEKVTFTFGFLFRLGDPSLIDQKAFEASARDVFSDRNLSDTTPSEDDFSPGKPYKGDLFTVEWKDRKCAGR